MTRIKLCGLSAEEDIEIANRLLPDYIGFVFAPKSRRYLPPERAAELKSKLDPGIRAVGVFVNEAPEKIAALLEQGIIDLAQLHGSETEEEIRELQAQSGKPVIRAFQVRSPEILKEAERSPADYILLDSGAGSGEVLDWELLKDMKRPFFLAGGLHPLNVREAIRRVQPFAVDVSSGIERDGRKDAALMQAFTEAVRKEEENNGKEDRS